MELPYLASSEFTSTIQCISDISECTHSNHSICFSHACTEDETQSLGHASLESQWKGVWVHLNWPVWENNFARRIVQVFSTYYVKWKFTYITCEKFLCVNKRCSENLGIEWKNNIKNTVNAKWYLPVAKYQTDKVSTSYNFMNLGLPFIQNPPAILTVTV